MTLLPRHRNARHPISHRNSVIRHVGIERGRHRQNPRNGSFRVNVLQGGVARLGAHNDHVIRPSSEFVFGGHGDCNRIVAHRERVSAHSNNRSGIMFRRSDYSDIRRFVPHVDRVVRDRPVERRTENTGINGNVFQSRLGRRGADYPHRVCSRDKPVLGSDGDSRHVRSLHPNLFVSQIPDEGCRIVIPGSGHADARHAVRNVHRVVIFSRRERRHEYSVAQSQALQQCVGRRNANYLHRILGTRSILGKHLNRHKIIALIQRLAHDVPLNTGSGMICNAGHIDSRRRSRVHREARRVGIESDSARADHNVS